MLSSCTSCGLSGCGDPGAVVDEHRDATASGGRRVDPGERRAVGGDERVGAVATDAEHGARSTMLMRTVAGSCVVTTALSTQGSASTRPWMAAPLMVKMLSSGTSAAATTALVVTRWAPTTVTWRTWKVGSVSTRPSAAICTASAAAAMARRFQEVRRRATGGDGACPRRECRRLRGDAWSFVPGLIEKRRTGRAASTISDAWARTRATWRARSSSTSVLTRRARCWRGSASTQAETWSGTLRPHAARADYPPGEAGVTGLTRIPAVGR